MTEEIPSEIFKLSKLTDNPLFGGLAMEQLSWKTPSILGRKSFHADITPGFGKSSTNRVWEPTLLSNLWKPPKVLGQVSAFQDFPCLNMVFPAFSRRACDALRDLLEPNGELLPLASDAGEYYFYNVTKVVDVLDPEKSVCDFLCEKPGTTEPIEYFAFHEKQLAGLSIFRILEVPIYTLVTDQFVKRVHDQGLNGFHFTKIWPFPPGKKWSREALQKEKGERKEKREMAAQVLAILFPLAGKKASAAEKKRISQIENELDAQLMVTSLTAPYFGNYKGSDTFENHYRMFVTCPDAEKLARKLMPWLKSTYQTDQIIAVKRFGDLNDPDVPEETLDLR